MSIKFDTDDYISDAIIIIIIILFGTLNMVHEVQLVNNNMTEQLNSDPRTLKSLIQLVNRGPLKAKNLLWEYNTLTR